MRILANMARKYIYIYSLLVVSNYTELAGGLDFMPCQLVVYVNNIYLLGEDKNTVIEKQKLF
jgi:hypothetical protein